MHGVKRDEAKNISPEKLKEQQETIERGRKLWDRMLQLRSEKAFTYEALKVTQKLIEMNPECYTPWNYRKQILLAKLGMPSTPEPEPEPEPQPEPAKNEGDEVEKKVEEVNKAEGESTTTEEPKKEEQTNVEPEVEDEETKKKRQQEEEDKKRQEEEAKEKAKKEAEEKRLLDRETKITLREKKELIQTDILEITNRAIRYNAKCYHVWYHRRWIMLQMKKLGESIRAGNEGPKHSSDTLSDDVNWQYDLDLTTQFLKLDSRNFHCWGYRRFVVTESGVTDEKELEYTETKLGEGGKFFSDGGSKSAQESSFSNYSAWHLRSLLLTKKIQDIRKNSATSSEDVKQLLDTEFEFVGQIVATHNGQSPWLYHRWLISQVEPEHKLEALQRELTLCEEIIKIDAELSPNDPPPKWATLTKALLLQGLKDVGETVDEKNIEALVDTLEKNDPDHSQFYSHLRQKALKI